MIELKNVSKTYSNGTQALKNVNLKIEQGEFVFVVGASGAGKSTFLKLILREEVPTSGEIIVNNYNLVTLKKKEIPYFRRTMGVVFQDFRLIQNMTVYDNVAFAMRVIGAKEKEIRKRVPYVLSLVGLQTKARNTPAELSGGEQQRVALARALVNNADMIIADEPTGNIDPEMSYEIVDLLNHLHKNGTTVVMVTHEHELVRQFNERVVVIENGCIVSDARNNDGLDYTSATARTLRKTNAEYEEAQKKRQGNASYYYAYDNKELNELIKKTTETKELEKQKEFEKQKESLLKLGKQKKAESEKVRKLRTRKHEEKTKASEQEKEPESLVEKINDIIEPMENAKTSSVREQYSIYLDDDSVSGGDDNA
ncbi:MAG: cell division ATP-binding protein FtsE [Clostridiales bacterium]|nr:cell division ATP-binding protein FtsE [Clostridiales bacterium]